MKGTIAKMQASLTAQANDTTVHYQLPMSEQLLELNTQIGKKINLKYSGKIVCQACGKKTKKSFAQGHCFPCFRRLARCDLCIMKPETCHFNAGTCREPQWGEKHCFAPHYVYLANSSAIKVGITRATQLPTRWIDQGATQALPIFKVKTRLQSGLIEVILKQHISDRTDWRKMLKCAPAAIDLKQKRDILLAQCSEPLNALIKEQEDKTIEKLDEEIVNINFPVTLYPEKIKSLNFDKQTEITGKLQGIKGQYLILDSGVLNIRKFTGYEITVSFL